MREREARRYVKAKFGFDVPWESWRQLFRPRATGRTIHDWEFAPADLDAAAHEYLSRRKRAQAAHLAMPIEITDADIAAMQDQTLADTIQDQQTLWIVRQVISGGTSDVDIALALSKSTGEAWSPARVRHELARGLKMLRATKTVPVKENKSVTVKIKVATHDGWTTFLGEVGEFARIKTLGKTAIQVRVHPGNLNKLRRLCIRRNVNIMKEKDSGNEV